MEFNYYDVVDPLFFSIKSKSSQFHRTHHRLQQS